MTTRDERIPTARPDAGTSQRHAGKLDQPIARDARVPGQWVTAAALRCAALRGNRDRARIVQRLFLPLRCNHKNLSSH